MTEVNINIKSTYDDSGTRKAMLDMDRLQGKKADMAASLSDFFESDVSGAVENSIKGMKAQQTAMTGSQKIFSDSLKEVNAQAIKDVLAKTLGVNPNAATYETNFSRLSERPDLFGSSIDRVMRGKQIDADKMYAMNKQAMAKNEGEPFINLIKSLKNPLLFLGLSSLFAGMAVQKAVQGMTKPAEDIVGIFDLVGAVFTLFFLPAVLALLPFLLQILELVSDFTQAHPTITKLIGLFVILVGVLGGLMAILGQAMTALAGIISVLGIGGVASAAAIGLGELGLGAGILGGSGILAKLFTPKFSPEAGMGGQAFTKPMPPAPTTVPETMAGVMKGQVGIPDINFGLWASRLGSAAVMELFMANTVGGKNNFDLFKPETWGDIFNAPTTAFVPSLIDTSSNQHITVTNNFNSSNSPNTMGGYAMNNSLAPV